MLELLDITEVVPSRVLGYMTKPDETDFWRCTGCDKIIIITDSMYELDEVIQNIKLAHLFCEPMEVDVVSGTIVA